MRGCIPDAAKITGIPSGTIRRWLAEGRLVRYGEAKPWRVDYDEIMALRKLLQSDALQRDAMPQRVEVDAE
jgi:predicted site-specific integrase-resolvase